MIDTRIKILIKIPHKTRILPRLTFVAEDEEEVGAEEEGKLLPPPPPPPKKNKVSLNVPASDSDCSISRYSNNWPLVTKNRFILNIVEFGYIIQFLTSPHQNYPVISNPSNTTKRLALAEQIKRNLLINSISLVTPSESQFVSRVFTVKKSNGDDRMIIDLSHLNTHVNKVHFKMEGIDTIKSFLSFNYYMVSIDLSDAFFSIPLHENSKKFTTFEFDGLRYSYNCLPFGLSCSPRIFSKVLRPVIIYLRNEGLKITSYMDDIFICNSSSVSLSNQVQVALNTLKLLGFKPNLKKSDLVPKQNLLHLGYLWNTLDMTISLPQSKIEKTRSLASKLLQKEKVTFRDISSFLGIVISHSTAMRNGPLHFRQLQLQFIKNFKRSNHWDDSYKLNLDSHSDLVWWSEDFFCDPVSFSSIPPDLIFHSDSSLSGWGCTLSSGEVASGRWTEDESCLHINYLELKAIYFGLQCFSSLISGKSVLIHCDNSTSVSYINKMGGTHSSCLCALSIQIWELAYQLDSTIKAVHIAGVLNVQADYFSRCNLYLHDYFLPQEIFSQLISLLDISPTVDLFASRISNKLPKFFSYDYDPYSSGINAFNQSWPRSCYLFPPITLIGKALQKFIEEQVEEGLLITPDWPGLPELPLIRERLTADPVSIPGRYLEGELPTRFRFNLVAWRISASIVKQMGFPKKPRTCF